METRISGQTSIFGIYFLSIDESLLGVNRQKNIREIAFLARQHRSHVTTLIHRTWAILIGLGHGILGESTVYV